ncbi:EAL domain-containing protein [Pseudoalteromonas sp. DL2-H2.2]|uniref:EAL domain-containing protein n=1 Tax=Pseudoalteromonas sp. DL2-H2.2 TaxID=2908889 RepID=UPI001F1B95FD|nr:EAL domain-containing protein [Pseudoalteromonas sp. DL2-H2.2]MCF2910692.1 EAL domain-containing protein [Pseudoalteromonas sp. DL2-H2.2]
MGAIKQSAVQEDDRTKPTILIVDDRPENHRVVRKILGDMRANFHSAESGHEVLSLVLRHKYAVILLDVMMPGIDGFETASLLRMNDETKHTPIIFITAADHTEALEFKGYEVGAVDYLFKPINAHTLYSKVQVFLELEQQRTKLLQSFQDIQELENKNRLLLKSIGEGILGVDTQGCITYTNPATEKILGLSENTLVGADVAEFICLSTSNAGNASWENCRIFEHCVKGYTYRDSYGLFKDNDKRMFPVEFIATPIYENNTLFGVVIAFQDISQKRSIEEQLSRLSQFDTLTGLVNRSTFEKHLQQAIKRSLRHNREFSLLHLDLDHFKQVNDQFGHEVGDILLQEVGHRIVKTVSDGDIVARIGGDEYVILLENFIEQHVRNEATLAEHLLSHLSGAYLIRGHEIFIGPSIGIARFPGAGEDSVSVLRAVELAMYRAKKQGGQNFQFFTDELHLQAMASLELEQKLRAAIELEEFTLFYQPQWDINNNRVNKVEALLRWFPADGSSLGPGVFIPKLEEMGLINKVGEWVVEQACRQAKKWRAEYANPPCIAVNLSMEQLRREELPEMVFYLLQKYQLPADAIEVEVTEGMMMQNPQQAIEILNAFQRLGIAVAIDDFGTGYSSFSYLVHLPINTLKIDREFIRKLGEGEKCEMVVRAIISLAHNMHLKVVAEGVETEQQLTFLLEQKCDYIQGYYFAKPASAAQVRLEP